MKTETLQKAKEIESKINDLSDRIKAISAIEDEGHECKSIKMEVQSKSKTVNDYRNDVYSSSSSIDLRLKEKIQEELLDCAVRIKRAFEKEIKNLEKEFETL